MRILLIKLLIPILILIILLKPFAGVLIFILSSFIRPEALTWGLLEARFAFIVSIVTLISWLMRVNRKSERGRITLEWWLMGLLLIMMTVSSFLSPFPSHSYPWNIKILKYLIFCLLMIQMINTEKRFLIYQWVIFIGVSFIALWGFEQHFRGNVRLEDVGGGDWADSSGLAALLNLYFPVIYYRARDRDWKIRYSAVFMIPIFIADIIFTQSRAGSIAIGASLFLLFIRSRHKVIFLILCLISIPVVKKIAPSTYMERMETIQIGEEEEMEASAQSRLLLWRVGLKVLKDHPLFGVGPSNFGRLHSRYSHIYYGKLSDWLYMNLFGQYRVLHSTFMDILVSCGIITFIVFLIFLFKVFHSLFKVKRLAKRMHWERFSDMARGIEVGIIAFLITGTFHDLTYLEVFYWQCITAGILSNIVRCKVDEMKPKTSKDGEISLSAYEAMNPWNP